MSAMGAMGGVRGVRAKSAIFVTLLVSLSIALPLRLPATPDTTFTMLQPDCVGEERFVRRLDDVRARGREPLGLVLSGGLARSYAHLGLLQVMEEQGIHPDFIVGDSLGAVVGLLYAAGLSPKTIVDISELLAERRLFDLVLPTSGGLFHAGRFAAALALVTGDPDIADLPIPVMVVADDLHSGRQVRIAQGQLSEVALASIALPLLFEPVPMEHRLLVDGGSTDLVPVAVAREYSDRVLVSTALHRSQGDLGGLVGILMRSFDSLLLEKPRARSTNFRRCWFAMMSSTFPTSRSTNPRWWRISGRNQRAGPATSRPFDRKPALRPGMSSGSRRPGCGSRNRGAGSRVRWPPSTERWPWKHCHYPLLRTAVRVPSLRSRWRTVSSVAFSTSAENGISAWISSRNAA